MAGTIEADDLAAYISVALTRVSGEIRERQGAGVQDDDSDQQRRLGRVLSLVEVLKAFQRHASRGSEPSSHV
jgi:hypothetical protein